MNAVVASFGTRATPLGADGNAVIVQMPDRRVRLELVAADGYCASTTVSPPRGSVSPSFVLAAFGSTRRLAWEAGGRAITASTTVVYWRDRYAIAVEPRAITIVDAERNRQIAIRFAELQLGVAVVVEDRLVVASHDDLMWLALDELVALEPKRATELELVTIYPLRDPAAVASAKIVWLFETHALVGCEGERWRLDRTIYGLDVQGLELRVRDRLWPGRYVTLEVPGREPAILHAPAAPRRVAVRVAATHPRDPAATGAELAPPDDSSTHALIHEIARTLADDAPRQVLADALQQRGDPYGEFIAISLIGGDDASARLTQLRRRHQRSWLGPLAHFLQDVEYERGMPGAATLVSRAPDDPALLAAAQADPRLCTFTALHRGKGSIEVYRQLIGSPHAVNLRRVTANDVRTLRALIAANRTTLVRLDDIRLSQKPVRTLLAERVFDSVSHLETIAQTAHLDGLLEHVRADAHGFFARAPRHLIVRPRFEADSLVGGAIARWGQLALASLAAGEVTLVRARGTIVRFHAEHGGLFTSSVRWFYAAELAALRDVEAVELTGGSVLASEVLALQRALPAARITVT